MRRRRKAPTIGGYLVLGLLLAFLLPACGGGGEGGVAASIPLGLGTRTASQEVPQSVLRTEGFRIDRTTGPPNIMIRTEWLRRTPFPGESELGVTEARTRIIVEGRERGSDIQDISLFNMRLRAENEGRTTENPNFHRLEATADFDEYVERIAREIRDRLESGIRMD